MVQNVLYVRNNAIIRYSRGASQTKGYSKQNLKPRFIRSCINASDLVVRENITGVEFPQVQQLWAGNKCRCLGAVVRSKKVLLLNVKVYVAALYAEAELAARELGIRFRGGYFDKNQDQEYCDAILDGAFAKCLVLHMVREVDGDAIFEAMDLVLKPRLQLTGELNKLQELKQIFDGQKFKNGDEILFLWQLDNSLNIHLNRGAQSTQRDPYEFSRISPQYSIEPSGMSRALFEVYLGSDPIIPQAIATWSQGARLLLETDTVRRNTFKQGSG